MSRRTKHSSCLACIKENFKCAEVGVWRGDLSKKILEKKPSELFLIDPWIHQEAKWVKWAKGEKAKEAYIHVKSLFETNDTVKIFKKKSLEFEQKINYFDWVYIDADHSYESVKNDLRHWFPQVKKGGFLCGDDYEWESEYTEGPKRAVDEFVIKNNLSKKIKQNQYIIQI